MNPKSTKKKLSQEMANTDKKAHVQELAQADKNQRPQELTRAELEIMQILWQRGKAVVRDILSDMPAPRPAYNTISTVVRILQQKGFVGHTAYGRTHEYQPLIGREEYTERYMAGVLGNFFDGSLARMVSFFAQRDNLSIGDFDEIIGILKSVQTPAGQDATIANTRGSAAETFGKIASEAPQTSSSEKPKEGWHWRKSSSKR